MSDLNKAIGKIIADLRRKSEHTQESLAFECELHPTYISQLERGLSNPTVRVLFLIAAATGVKASTILRRVEDIR